MAVLPSSFGLPSVVGWDDRKGLFLNDSLEVHRERNESLYIFLERASYSTATFSSFQ